MGRFISPDRQISGVGGDIIGYNMFAYCMNNPVNMSDSNGDWPKWMKSISKWVDNNIVKPIKGFAQNIKEDCKNYSKGNTSEEKVLDAHYFSSYKDTPVINPPIGYNAASFGVMIIGDKVDDEKDVKHEYGHRVQLDKQGLIRYTINVAIPSVTANILDRMEKLPYDYYGAPWEAEANIYGGVNRFWDNDPWPNGAYNSYIDLIKLFFE